MLYDLLDNVFLAMTIISDKKKKKDKSADITFKSFVLQRVLSRK